MDVLHRAENPEVFFENSSVVHQRNSSQADRIKHYFLTSPANVFCTSDRDIPISRAIRAGVTPALNAARTAFNFPCGIEGKTAPASRFR
jgi:hypothetical protein